MAHSSSAALPQTLIGAGGLALGAVLAYGATFISSDAGYAGVGPNFLPWVVAGVLSLCGGWLIYEARTGGFRQMDEASGAARGDWSAFAWVAAGVLANAALITGGLPLPDFGLGMIFGFLHGWRVPKLGFVLSCTVCFMLAVRGLRQSEGKSHGGVRGLVLDFVTGFLIAAPAFWLFTKLLGINLPGLTSTGWI
jgi:putative tricarboxylic transport membrane protein